MFRIIREIRQTIDMANAIAAQAGEGPRWSLFITNRSFIAQVVATCFALMALFGVFVPVGAEDIVELISIVGFIASQGWSLYERYFGKTRTIWNKDQAVKAVQEADALTVALKNAGAPVAP
jgi:hypothetical protein